MGFQRVGHDWATSLSLSIDYYIPETFHVPTLFLNPVQAFTPMGQVSPAVWSWISTHPACSKISSPVKTKFLLAPTSWVSERSDVVVAQTGKNSPCSSIPGLGRIPWRREWLPTPVFLPGESHRQKSLAGYSPWGRRVGQDWATITCTLHFHA